jgi:transposase
LNQQVKALIGRDLSMAFYDLTNYFFEIDFPDDAKGLRQRGVSKEHRVDPIVSMGLFIDTNGLPVSMALFPGNTSDTVTLHPMMKEIKTSYGLGRLLVVADKGITSSSNIEALLNNGDGYVLSQILRGKKGQRYHARLLDTTAYHENQDGSYRYQLFTEDYLGKDREGNPIPRQRKVLLYWSKAEADLTRRKREEKLIRAERMVSNKVYGIKKGIEEYTREELIDPHTGELLEQVKKVRLVDFQKAADDARFDGYFCLITSELDWEERKIREVYHGLWRIEQSFRILKSDLYARPVFVWKQDHIRAHFLICFTALLMVRILQYRMGKKALSVERIVAALTSANCRVLKHGIVHLEDVGGAIAFRKSLNAKGEELDTLVYSKDDEIALDYRHIQDTVGTAFYDSYPRQEHFNQFLKSIRRA